MGYFGVKWVKGVKWPKHPFEPLCATVLILVPDRCNIPSQSSIVQHCAAYRPKWGVSRALREWSRERVRVRVLARVCVNVRTHAHVDHHCEPLYTPLLPDTCTYGARQHCTALYEQYGQMGALQGSQRVVTAVEYAYAYACALCTHTRTYFTTMARSAGHVRFLFKWVLYTVSSWFPGPTEEPLKRDL